MKPDTRIATPWSVDQEARFFDAIADGSSIAAAARLVGKPLGSGASKFRRFARSLGSQGQ